MTATLPVEVRKPEKSDKRPDVIETFNPATGEKLGEVRVSTAEDVRAKAVRAREAQKEWHAIGVDERNRVLKNLQRVMLDRADEIISTINKENGKPRDEAVTMILSVCEAINYYTKLATKKANGVRVSPCNLFMGAKARVFYEPRGVAGFIMPWNFPFELGMKHMVPALAAGNAAIQKPSEFNPLIGELIGSLYAEAGVPDGLVQIVHGYAEVGTTLIDQVDIVTFVGSPQTGRKIMARAAERLIPVILELGGNDAAIVRKDADVDRAARGIVTGACLNAGQTCVSIERVYAHKDVAKELTEKIVAHAKKLSQNVTGGHYDLGPVKWAPQRKIYESQIADAVSKGAKVELGGKPIEEHGGLFFPPTVVTGVSHEMELMKEETFGPIIPVMSFESDDEAVKLANDCEYGLGGSVWTADVEEGERMARKINAGHVMLNNAVVSAACPALPFGGNGVSGVGRAFGEIGYYNYTSPRSFLRTPANKMGELGWMPYAKNTEPFILSLGRMLYLTDIPQRLKGLLGVIKNRPR